MDIDLNMYNLVKFLADHPGTTVPLEKGASVFVPGGVLPLGMEVYVRGNKVIHCILLNGCQPTL